MSEHEPQRHNPNISEHLRNPEQDGRILLPDTLKERMLSLYSQEHEPDPMVVCKFFDPVGSWTWYATEGSPVDEDGYYDTAKAKVDYLFFGLVARFVKELGYFSLHELQTLKEGMRGIRALPIERDVYFTPTRLSEVRRLHEDI